MTAWLLSNNFLTSAWGMLRTSILLFDDCLAYAWQPEDYFTTTKMIVILNRHINNLPYPKGKEIGHHGQPYLQKSHNFGQNLEILAIVFVDLRYRLSAEQWADIRSCCSFWLDLFLPRVRDLRTQHSKQLLATQGFGLGMTKLLALYERNCHACCCYLWHTYVGSR